MCWWCGAGSKRPTSARWWQLAKKSPGALNYASTGVGSASHLAAELFKTKAGVDLQHIPFRGSAPMTTELLAGRVDLTFATLPSVITHIDAGAVRALAVASAEARRAAAEPADARGSRRARRRGRRLVRAVRAGEDAGRDRSNGFTARCRPALTTEAAIEGHRHAGHDAWRCARPPELAAWLPGEVAKWAAVIKAAGVARINRRVD